MSKECESCKNWRQAVRKQANAIEVQAEVIRKLKKQVKRNWDLAVEIFFAMVKINVDAKEKASRK